MRKPLSVANKILEIASETDDPYVTPMQLIKLAYLSHAWMLGLHGRPLLNESVEAWKYGPVVRSIYSAVRHHKDQPVLHPIRTFFGREKEEEFEEIETELIRQVYAIYGKFDGITLSNLTHQPGSPWDLTWRNHGQNAVIPNDLIEHFYRRFYERLTNKGAEGAQEEPVNG